ncbi:MAG: hypothetical protein H6868_09110 [Rhodospirillales bacterium]|nr:hypothetical protein [Rhodospirillales bacterium]
MTGEHGKAIAISIGVDDVSSGGGGGRPPQAHSDLVTAFITSARNKLRTHFNNLTEKGAQNPSTSLKSAITRTGNWLDSMSSNGKKHLLYAAAVHLGVHKMALNP